MEIDTENPSPARVYDYVLGGKDNYAADRKAAGRVLEMEPHARDSAVENRRFLARVVKHLAGQGIKQFLDLGSGLPTMDNVHQVARRHVPDARVAYVDFDPMVLAHARALVKPDEGVTYIHSDIRDVDTVLKGARGLLDLSRPVALLAIAVLHFVPDEDDPAGLVATYARELASGSRVAISCASTEDVSPELVNRIRSVYDNAPSPLYLRPRDRIRGLFGDLELLEPGLVHVTDWPVPSGAARLPLTMLGGVAMIP
ncbi:SAM-dependent methyltransferase [Actinomadura miaoliensis]|uniref:SAM-dependent methyltransferase n=1 Tax=Actinomadura miaoliensis TaxID=430685 RepID=UPI0031EBE854